MTITAGDSILFLSSAGVDLHAPDEHLLLVPRVEICRRLMMLQYSYEPGITLRWNNPISAIDEYDACNLFRLPLIGDVVNGVFGDLVFYIEGRLRDLWRPNTAPACACQSVFYELRHAIRAGKDNSAGSMRLRPDTPLRSCLSPEQTRTLTEVLYRRFGIEDVPVSERVFGRMEFGATWLSLWFLEVFVCCACFGDTGLPFYLFWVIFFGSAWLTAVALDTVSYPVWTGNRTLGDLTRWTIQENARVIEALETTPGEVL